jgi:hypothetical protein
VQDEMIARSPHVDAAGNPTSSFIADRQKVWDLISSITRDKDCWTYVKPAQRARNGRMAFMGLHNRYLGPNNVDNMAAMAESKLATLQYAGEKKRWNWEKYVRAHSENHSILEGLVDQGYSGIDERSKVRHLMEGIKTDDYDSVKGTILSSAALRNSFDDCVTLYTDFIAQKKTTQNVTFNVSAFQADADDDEEEDGKTGKTGWTAPIQDRYYNNEQYGLFNKAQKAKLHELRLAREGNGKSSGSGKGRRRGKGGGSDMANLKRQISALTAALLPKDDDSQDRDDREDQAADNGNRDHPGLTRQQKKRKTD